MRHVRSFVLSLVLAPLIWALTGLSLLILAGGGPRLPADQARQVGLGGLVAAGLLVAVLALARLSPLGPALAGASFLSAVAYAPSVYLVVPDLPSGLDEAMMLPADGYAVVLGIPLLATALSARRWRRTASLPIEYAAPAPTLVSPAPTLVSPPGSTLGSRPGSTLVSPPGSTLGSPPGSTYVSAPAATYVAPTAPNVADPQDPWPPWWHPGAASESPAPADARGAETVAETGQLSPWARPSAPSIDDETDDLSEALRPLRASTRPPAR
jgi:hypothetical protein